MSAELSTRSPEQVIHLTLREGLSAIYLPQVIRPMSHMRSRGHDVCLLVFSAVGDYLRPLLRRRWQEQQARAGAAGLKLIRLPCPPARAPRLWSEVSVLRRWLTRNRTRNRRSLHCRGPLATDIALSACAGLNGVEVVFDCRGLIGAEYLYERGHLTPDTAPVEIRTQAARLEAIERSCAQRSQRVICVSEAMKRHLIESWQITEAKISVVPCCTDTAEFARDPQRRIQMRQHLGIDNKFVLVYSGSMAAWQMPHESAVLFREVQRRRPDAHLLVISRQADAFNTMLKDIGLRNGSWTTVAASNDQVREYLWAGDVALLIRERCLVNRVASPVKYAEYLAAGLPVIISEGIGDQSSAAIDQGFGIGLDDLPSRLQSERWDCLSEQIDRLNRDAAKHNAATRLDWQRYH